MNFKKMELSRIPAELHMFLSSIHTGLRTSYDYLSCNRRHHQYAFIVIIALQSLQEFFTIARKIYKIL